MVRIDWKQAASVTVTVAGGLAALYLLCRFAFVLVLPFLLAFVMAVATRRTILSLSARTRCPVRVMAALVTLFSLTVFGLFVFLLCNRLFVEAQNLLDFLATDSQDPNGQIARFFAFFRDFGSRLPLLSQLRDMPFLRDLIGDPEAYLVAQLQNGIEGVTGRLAALVGGVLRRLPRVAFFLVFTVISCFYFAIDYEAVTRTLTAVTPRTLRAKLPVWRERITAAAKRYLRAYFWLFLLTLGELLVGFFLLGIRYAFLLALLTAFLDILPVLGVGVILVPFAVFLIAVGQTGRGIGLLILYAVITVVRQVAEPHLVGKSLGLHPILMLLSLYVGLGVFGVAGFLLGPAIALIAKAVFDWACAENKRAEKP